MQTSPPIQRPSLKMIANASAGLALVTSSAFSFVACSTGFLFSGISAIFTVFVAVAVCTVVTAVTALILRRRQNNYQWRIFFIEVLFFSLLAVGLLSWFQTRQAMQMFFYPRVPNGVHVLHGYSSLFSTYVHFSAPPAVIAAAIHANGLTEAPAEMPATGDSSGYVQWQKAMVSWDWWQPSTMSKPRFFYLHHASELFDPPRIGWCVNSDTNEVYAFFDQPP